MCSVQKLCFRGLVLVFFLLLGGSLSGCSLLSGTLNSFDRMTAGAKQRQEMLSTSLDKYHRAVYWGDLETAAAFVSDEVKNSFTRDMLQRKQSEKLVEIKIEAVDYDIGGESALVRTTIRYFQIPQYVVQHRREQELWKFDRFGNGWLAFKVEELQDEPSTEEVDEGPSFRGKL